jgi:hypothetical protein
MLELLDDLRDLGESVTSTKAGSFGSEPVFVRVIGAIFTQ